MQVQTAKEIVRRWVLQEAAQLPGFAGAFFHGSINWLDDDDTIPTTSDVDVLIAFDTSTEAPKLGKFVHEGVMIEASPIPLATLQSPQEVLTQYPIVGGFRRPGIILDPTGRLTALQAQVAPEYARRRWVVARCKQARDRVLAGLAALNHSAPFHEQVAAWLFSAGVTTHILLVAGLKNPTVRRRYAAVRDLLAEYGRVDFHSTLLEMMGADQMLRARAELHLDALADAFDDAATVISTPYRFAADMTPPARPVAIDGSRELIRRGDHREALFWITAVYSRSMHVLSVDAPSALLYQHTVGYRRLLADLGIQGEQDLRRGGQHIAARLPDVWTVAEEIMAANPEITD